MAGTTGSSTFMRCRAHSCHMARCLHAPNYGMAKLYDSSALLLVVLALFTSFDGLVTGETVFVDLDADNAVSKTADTVTTSTFFGWPYFRWWPVGYCAWDFSTTGIWQITFAGRACNAAYGAKLANYARTTMRTSRSFRGVMMGVSPVTSTVICAKGSKAGQVIYTVQARTPNTPAGRQVMQRLRSMKGGGGLALARNMFTVSSTRTIGLFTGKYNISFKLLAAARCSLSLCPSAECLRFIGLQMAFALPVVLHACNV